MSTTKLFLQPTDPKTDAEVTREHRELEKLLGEAGEVNFDNYFYAIFRYRDPRLCFLFRDFVSDLRSSNELMFLWSVAILGETGDISDFDRLAPLLSDSSPLVREYAANALGRLGGKTRLAILKERLANEQNGYVLATLEAAIRRIEKPLYAMPVTGQEYTGWGLRKLRYFYNTSIAGGAPTYYEAKIRETPPEVTWFVYPHQQYRDGIFSSAPLGNFGGEHVHVGEDSGWFLYGLPVHVIADGVVAAILYDLSWGTVIVVEHRVLGEGPATSFYGHLGWDIDVRVGDRVVRGQKIGEVGPAVSVENGGYWPHLHLGISKNSFEETEVVGYDFTTDDFYNPIVFIPAHL